MISDSYVCPMTRSSLTELDDGLMRDDGTMYPYMNALLPNNKIPNFLHPRNINEKLKRSLDMYDTHVSSDIYRNFLDWLFLTFDENETAFRKMLSAKLHVSIGSRVLVTGCGLGDDLPSIMDIIGPSGNLYAQDLSPSMIMATQSKINLLGTQRIPKTFCSVGNAATLPFRDGFFDAALHFGGINLFDDVKGAIREMSRVVKIGGKVVVGDEGVAPWLKSTEYGNIAICNNALWAAEPPLSLLPETSQHASVTWILGNCFYVIEFTVSDKLPYMNIDLVHKGRRGGSARTRYFGQLEGVTIATKKRVLEAASAAGMSVHDWLEKAISQAL